MGVSGVLHELLGFYYTLFKFSGVGLLQCLPFLLHPIFSNSPRIFETSFMCLHSFDLQINFQHLLDRILNPVLKTECLRK